MPRLRLSFEIPLILFLISALGGVRIAYDTPAAWSRLLWIAGGLALSLAVAYAPARLHLPIGGKVSLLRVLFAGLPLVVIIYFLLTNDWSYRLGKLPWLDPMLRFLMLWQPHLPGGRLDTNLVGGVIAAFMPLQFAALRSRGSRNRVYCCIAAILLGVSAVCLFLSESRGAWLALTVVVAGWWLYETWGPRRLAARSGMKTQRAQAIWIALGLSVVLTLLVTSLGQHLLLLRPDRWEAWRNSLDLASDYPFSGVGLSGFPMAYSSYVLLIHVPYIQYAANLFLDVQLQQGLLGLLVFLGWILIAFWHSRPGSGWTTAARVSLGVITVHGLFDDAFYGYGGQGTLLLFLPLAILAREAASVETATAKQALLRRASPQTLVTGLFLVGGIMLLAGLASLIPGLRAAYEANLGAISQTRIELSASNSPDWQFQDRVRRSEAADLAPAIAHYQTALTLDPANTTANRRLGQIELSLGQYDEARYHLAAAYAASPSQRATRQMLGESYAIAGDIGSAMALWPSIDVRQGQLQMR